MRLNIIPGLIALQLAAAVSASAQNYYVKIGGDNGTRIADHASWEQGPSNFDESLEAYNLNGGNNAVGLMRFYGPAGSVAWAAHHRLAATSEQVKAIRILPPAFNNGLYVVGEKIAAGGGVKSAVVLQYDLSSGHLLSSNELPVLPAGYQFLHVYDVISEPEFNNRLRILCTVTKDSDQAIMELLYSAGSNTYKVQKYKPMNIPPEKYTSVNYVRAYHYGEFNLGEISFYGMAYFKNKPVAYCYAEHKYEMYQLWSAKETEGVAGVQMNGSYGVHGDHRRIDMAFIDMDGGLCMQQKDELNVLNWRRFYSIPKATFEMGWGRDGHGTKAGGGMDYFMAATHFSGDSDKGGHVTSLHYNAFNGDLRKPNVYNLSGVGVMKGGGFPNATYDPNNKYMFIADRFNQLNGFKFGISDATAEEVACTKPVAVKEERNTLKEKKDEMDVASYETYDAPELEMVVVSDISVDIIAECSTEQRATAKSSLSSSESKLYVGAERMRIEASGKTIAALRLYTIDGRLITNAQQVNNSNYEQQFNTPLTPGLYIINIAYTDHSRETRKVSVQ